ncbi:MAG: hypothetical protein P4L31_00935 [Candidatus Babeliales bacterium]|nr:hypothetical protein [Candidatus Babeliales bacterium]
MIKIIKAFLSAGVASMALIAAILLLQGTCKSRAIESVAQGQILAYRAPYAGTQATFYQYLSGKPWSGVVERYTTQQAKQEQSLNDEVFNILGINQEQFNQYKAEFYPLYLGSQEKQCCQVTARAKKEICEHEPLIFDFLLEHEIDVSSMKVIPTEDMGIAAATQSNLYIDDAAIVDKKKNDLTDLAQADILHEMQHVLHDDSFNIFVIKNLLLQHAQSCPTKIKQYKKLLSRFDKFREKRADILAGLVDPLYARVSADYYADQVALGLGDEPCDTHPTPATRYAYLNQLHKEIDGTINEGTNNV